MHKGTVALTIFLVNRQSLSHGIENSQPLSISAQEQIMIFGQHKTEALFPASEFWLVFSVLNYAASFCVSSYRCRSSLSFCILLWSQPRLCAIANKIYSACTFSVPRHRNLTNPLSPLISAKHPSACMLLFLRSFLPSSEWISLYSSSRSSSNFLDTVSVLYLSLSGFFQFFPSRHFAL